MGGLQVGMGRGRSREVPSTCWGRSHSMQAGSSPSQHAMGAPEASTSGASGPAPPKPAAASSWRPLLRTGAVGFVGGVLLWGVSDVLGEFTTFLKLRERALSLASESQELKDQIGYPFSTGPWYNSSIGFTGGGNIAMATFQLQVGERCSEKRPRWGVHRGQAAWCNLRLAHACARCSPA